MNNYKNKHKGFTLMEAMIVVAIIGVISAIALPNYTEYVRKGKRADAKVELLKLAQIQESYFVQNLSYASTLAQLGLTGTVKSEQEEYIITINKSPAACNGGTTACTGFTLIATPPTGSAQANDTACPSFTLSNTGGKGTSTGATAAAIKKCWK